MNYLSYTGAEQAAIRDNLRVKRYRYIVSDGHEYDVATEQELVTVYLGTSILAKVSPDGAVERCNTTAC